MARNGSFQKTPPQGERDGQVASEDVLRVARMTECSKALGELLDKHRCKLVAVVQIRGSLVASQVELESL